MLKKQEDGVFGVRRHSDVAGGANRHMNSKTYERNLMGNRMTLGEEKGPKISEGHL